MNKEYAFQVAVIDWLYGRQRKGNKTYGCNPPMPGLLFTHHYAGRKGGQEGYFLQQLGVRPGVADIINFWSKDGILHSGFLELKVDTDMSGAQHKIKGICIQLGIKYEMARTTAQVIAVYHKWGLNPLHVAIKTPDYRTWDEKTQDAHEFYKPREIL